MNLSLWGIRHPLAAGLVFAVLCIAGLWGFRELPVSSLPDIALPTVQITVTLPGATPSQLETDVTRRIEDAVASLAGIDKIVSAVSEGSSVTRVEFELGRDLDEALDEIRDAVGQARADLPQDVEEPLIQRLSVAGSTLIAYAVESDRMAADELSWFVDDVVTRALFGVSGVGQVSRTGGVDREVLVALRPAALQSLGVTAGAVSLQLARLQLERPGGRTTAGGGEQSVRTISTVGTAAELENYPIHLPDGRQVRLSALAAVTDGGAEPKSAALLDDRAVVGVGVQRTRGSSDVAVGLAVRQRIAELAAAHPPIRFTEVASTVEDASASFNSSMQMLLEGALLAVIVVWLFLRDWRATWISALALPLSVLPTFGVIHWLGFSLNLLSLLALSVVVGVLVDDAIVEVENVARHRALGKSPRQAAIDAADEIGIAVIATSATLAAVFVPVAFMPGVTGKFFREFGWTAAAAVLFSLLVARLLTPMLAAYFMRGEPRTADDSKLLRRYLGWVESALSHRRRVLSYALLSFVLSLALIPLIPTTFLPASDPSRAQLQLELPPGARLDDTLAVASEARRRLQAVPELEHVFTTIGGSDGGGHGGGMGVSFSELRKATLSLRFQADRHRSTAQIEEDVRNRLLDLPGVRVSFQAAGPGDRLDLVIAGRDSELLGRVARDLATQLRTLPGLGGVTSSASLLRPEILIRPDPARAADLGVSTVDIAEAARIATSGDFRQRLAKLNLAERQVPIRVQLADASLHEAGVLRQLRVPGAQGPVSLAAVAQISEGSGPARIDRMDRERNVTISAELNGRPLGEVMSEVARLEAMRTLPPGVVVKPSGDSRAFIELFVGFGLAMLTGVGCIYLVLLLLFNSATQPLTILAAVPLCGGGAFGLLLLTGYALSLPSLIGLLLLTGIATKNSILIVDYAILGERAGLSRHDALLDACRKRARPVIMTTIAMGAGMLPIALGLGADGGFRAPLGVSVIGGLVTSTLLSLVVVPAAYSVVGDLTDRWRRRRAGRAAGGLVSPTQA
ncbi:MAG: efflux RND transporter permease subunit [Sinobacteraceae bacterium]|nr:efflux RND transporter permease subunit [Nevskiaceae bacterium]